MSDLIKPVSLGDGTEHDARNRTGIMGSLRIENIATAPPLARSPKFTVKSAVS